MATYGFHPEALAEYHAAANFYLEQASPLVAASFLAEVETSISKIRGNPGTWRVVEAPGFRRYLIRRFPYALYYRWESQHHRMTIYAVMHLRRKPGVLEKSNHVVVVIQWRRKCPGSCLLKIPIDLIEHSSGDGRF